MQVKRISMPDYELHHYDKEALQASGFYSFFLLLKDFKHFYFYLFLKNSDAFGSDIRVSRRRTGAGAEISQWSTGCGCGPEEPHWTDRISSAQWGPRRR